MSILNKRIIEATSSKDFGVQLTTQRISQVWAVGGGKGGIGKSFISSSLAINLANLGYKVTAIDLDLGAANLHTALGINLPSQGISDFLSGKVNELQEVIASSTTKNLNVISGANDSFDVADISQINVNRVINSINQIQSDFIVLDLGAGTHFSTLDFFLSADVPILVMTPEPSSIENAYRFIKSAFYRKLRLIENKAEVAKIIEVAMENRNSLGIKTPNDLLDYVNETFPKKGVTFSKLMKEFSPHILLNQVRSRQDVELGYSIRSVCKKYFGIETQYCGYLDFDNAVWQSLRKRKPFLLDSPYSFLLGQFTKISKHLVDPQKNRRMV